MQSKTNQTQVFQQLSKKETAMAKSQQVQHVLELSYFYAKQKCNSLKKKSAHIKNFKQHTCVICCKEVRGG